MTELEERQAARIEELEAEVTRLTRLLTPSPSMMDNARRMAQQAAEEAGIGSDMMMGVGIAMTPNGLQMVDLSPNDDLGLPEDAFIEPPK